MNDLLYANNEGLTRAFILAKQGARSADEPKYFTVECAREFFLTFTERKLWKVTADDVNKYFVYSLMTIFDEHEKSIKYNYLSQIEWVEMLCRLALIGFKGTEIDLEPISSKVEHFLEGMWVYFYYMQYWDENDEGLRLIKLNSEFFED